MTQEDKDLLLEDICSRLPYRQICVYKESSYEILGCILNKINISKPILSDIKWIDVEDCKPYLRPMSSMTEEEKRHVSKMMCLNTYDNGVVYDLTYPIYTPYYVMEDCLNYLRSIHVDYLGLIEKGLAIEVTENDNPYN